MKGGLQGVRSVGVALMKGPDLARGVLFVALWGLFLGVFLSFAGRLRSFAGAPLPGQLRFRGFENSKRQGVL